MWRMENTKSFFCYKNVSGLGADVIQEHSTFFYSIFPQQVSLEAVNPTLTELSGKFSILCLEKLRLRGSPRFKVYTMQ